MKQYFAQSGKALPLGATIEKKGVNFALFSEHATKVTLCLMDTQKEEIFARFPLDPQVNKTGDIWHVFIEDLQLPILYAFRIDGSQNSPLNYNPKALVIDPYAKMLKVKQHFGDRTQEYKPKAFLQEIPSFDWQNISSPNIPVKDLVIYEMHVRGFTKDFSSQTKHSGTFLGVIEKIPYLLDLGVNAVELMPVQEFNECANERKNPVTQETLCNYWGYSPLHYFFPMMRYSCGSRPEDVLIEFKTMVRELHRNGIEVLLDVVFNHTGEKKNQINNLSFLGIDRPNYYLLDKGLDTNFTGCGNTLNCNHPIMQQFLIDCMRYWVSEMHIDGFRFDLASIFNRDMEGNLQPMSSMIAQLSYDPYLAKTKLIAEPWDAAGAYQLGGFFPKKSRWSEWNGKYRDALRCFIRGDLHSKNAFAMHISGSQTIFPLRNPQASLNFITAHDGYTLTDLVSYEKKHNLANGENNQDGNNANFSANHGVEGVAQDAKILTLRQRQKKNFFLALMLSQGVPMILMGDEYGHTKLGNNNTWCHDSRLNWFLWDQLKENYDLYSFVRRAISFRKENSLLRREKFFKEGEILWHGTDPLQPNWDQDKPFLAFTITDEIHQENIYAAFNPKAELAQIKIPSPPQGKTWRLVFDTSKTLGKDFYNIDQEPQIEQLSIQMLEKSSLVLIARAVV